MRLIKRLLLSLTVLFGLVGNDSTARAAEEPVGVWIQGILVIASDKAGPPDESLAPYEPTLRKILRFESYRKAGEGTVSFKVPGSGVITLGGGHRIEMKSEESSSWQVRERIRWVQGDRVLQNTVVVLSRGLPVVLGGPSAGKPGEVYAIILVSY